MWSHNFLGNTFWCATRYLKCQPPRKVQIWNLEIVNSFVKRQYTIHWSEYVFRKKPIPHKNIQTLAVEMLKVKNWISPEIALDVFTLRIDNHCNLRNVNHFETQLVRTICNQPKIWDIVSEQYKKLNNLNSCKESIKKLVLLNCPCRVCKTYINRVGFLEG